MYGMQFLKGKCRILNLKNHDFVISAFSNMTVVNNDFTRASYMPVRIKGIMPHGANYWQDNGVTEPTRDDYVYHVEFNHIHDYGEGILSDFGGIYMGKSELRIF